MGVILGIDVGGSTTKIVGYTEKKELIAALQVRATDQLTSLYGAIGHFLYKNSVPLSDVRTIVLTGVGSSYISENIYNIPTYKINEFQAIGWGGLMLSGLDEALVVSMGTGTAYVRATKEKVIHIGGSGVGGGTLIGLSEQLFQENDIDAIDRLARRGDLQAVDLLIKDISTKAVSLLPPDMTASNFGSIKSTATSADLALGLINMIFQTIGMLAVFACRNDTIKDIVFTGSMTVLPQAKEIFAGLKKMYDLNFIIPDNAVFATAIGAAIPYLERPGGLDGEK
jgi:type II pantothenate kinase